MKPQSGPAGSSALLSPDGAAACGDAHTANEGETPASPRLPPPPPSPKIDAEKLPGRHSAGPKMKEVPGSPAFLIGHTFLVRSNNSVDFIKDPDEVSPVY